MAFKELKLKWSIVASGKFQHFTVFNIYGKVSSSIHPHRTPQMLAESQTPKHTYTLSNSEHDGSCSSENVWIL
jgi:hypothetical protein